ncbi:MAG: glucose ABC transporter permease GlcU [Nitrososphaeria archaeon]
MNEYARKVVHQAVLLFLAAVWLIPIYAMFINGLKTNAGVLSTAVLVPSGISFEAFSSQLRFTAGPVLNSLIVVLPVSVIGAYFGALGAFAFYRYTSHVSDAIFAIVSLATFMPVEAVVLPLTKFIVSIGLFNNYLGLIIAYLVFYLPTGALLMSIFMVVFPKQIIEAARVDGASEWTLFNRVVLPLMIPGVISTFIYILVEAWDNFFLPLVLTKTPNMMLAPIAAMRYVAALGAVYNQVFAASFLISIVPFVIFIFLGRYFIRGLLVLGGGAKG